MHYLTSNGDLTNQTAVTKLVETLLSLVGEETFVPRQVKMLPSPCGAVPKSIYSRRPCVQKRVNIGGNLLSLTRFLIHITMPWQMTVGQFLRICN